MQRRSRGGVVVQIKHHNREDKSDLSEFDRGMIAGARHGESARIFTHNSLQSLQRMVQKKKQQPKKHPVISRSVTEMPC